MSGICRRGAGKCRCFITSKVKLNMKNINSWKDNHCSIIEKNVFRLQLRIYKAATNQEFEKMHKTQKLLISSQSAKYLSLKMIRQTRSNSNLRTFKSKSRENQHTRFILTIENRSKQILTYLALYPQWKVEFEAENSGFKPEKSELQIIENIFLGISRNPKWVLNGEILNSFDQIDHKYLLNKCNTFPELYQQIEIYLKAGILDGKKDIFSDLDNPLSCLLVNIALHGLKKYIDKYIKIRSGNSDSLTFVRYATDFVLLHPDKKVLKNVKSLIIKFLKPIRLRLNSKKTQITHTLPPGFTFLDFNIFQQIKWVRLKKSESNLQFVTLIIPSKNSLKKHKSEIRQLIRRYRGASQERLLQKLNPVIRNWALSKSTQMSCKTFQALDQFVIFHLWKWVKRRHPLMSNYKLKKKYWHQVRTKKWVFGVKTNDKIILQLQLHSKILVKDYLKVTKLLNKPDSIF